MTFQYYSIKASSRNQFIPFRQQGQPQNVWVTKTYAGILFS